MTTKVYEKGLRAESCVEHLLSSGCLSEYRELILLPIPTTKDGIHLSGYDMECMEAVLEAGHGTLVVGYGIPEDVGTFIIGSGGEYVDVMLDERFLVANAELTARAMLGILLTEGERSVEELRLGIVGYGRIGRALLRLLLFLGAKVRVFTTSEVTERELGEMGIETFPSGDPEGLVGLDILINTAPSQLIAPEDIPPGLVIMELASGENFLGVKGVLRYPSLPQRLYPRTAGRLWAMSVERLLEAKRGRG